MYRRASREVRHDRHQTRPQNGVADSMPGSEARDCARALANRGQTLPKSKDDTPDAAARTSAGHHTSRAAATAHEDVAASSSRPISPRPPTSTTPTEPWLSLGKSCRVRSPIASRRSSRHGGRTREIATPELKPAGRTAPEAMSSKRQRLSPTRLPRQARNEQQRPGRQAQQRGPHQRRRPLREQQREQGAGQHDRASRRRARPPKGPPGTARCRRVDDLSWMGSVT